MNRAFVIGLTAVALGLLISVLGSHEIIRAVLRDLREQNFIAQIGIVSGLAGLLGFQGLLMHLPFIAAKNRVRSQLEELQLERLKLSTRLDHISGDEPRR